jgi:phosphohistidine phosphatase
MSRELWLLRHGEAEQFTTKADIDRNLTHHGEHEARHIAKTLHKTGLRPDALITSPAVRARQTACLVAPTLGWDETALAADSRLYFQGIAAVKTLLAELPPSLGRVLLVGHNPDFENLLLELVGFDNLRFRGDLMPTATWVRIGLPDDWQHLAAECGTLLAREVP